MTFEKNEFRALGNFRVRSGTEEWNRTLTRTGRQCAKYKEAPRGHLANIEDGADDEPLRQQVQGPRKSSLAGRRFDISRLTMPRWDDPAAA